MLLLVGLGFCFVWLVFFFVFQMKNPRNSKIKLLPQGHIVNI